MAVINQLFGGWSSRKNSQRVYHLDKGKHSKYETYAKRADVKSTASSYKFLIWFVILN